MQVYRFRNQVAINPPDGATFYLSARAANAMAAALQTVADDIPRAKFHESTLSGVTIEESNP